MERQQAEDEGDVEVAKQFMDSMVNAANDLQQQLDLIARQIGQGQTERCLELLKAQLNVGAAMSSPQAQSSSPSLSAGQFKKPLRSSLGGGSTPLRSTPLATTPKRHQIDFDAFPSTPTLEQLGLSGHALALVGGESGGSRSIPRSRLAQLSSEMSEPSLRAPMSSSSAISSSMMIRTDSEVYSEMSDIIH